MSSKVNVAEIVCGHFKTLRSIDGKYSKADLFTFTLLPGFLAVVSVMLNYNLDAEIRSLLVNFGAIFTALLLSVLVLVYDQEGKCSNAFEADALNQLKKKLLHELYYNISFSIICSVALIIFSLLHALVGGISIDFAVGPFNFSRTLGSILVAPLIVYLTTVIFLNVIMVVKRMHTLLTTRGN